MILKPVLAAFAALLILALPAAAAGYLKLGDIKGEATDAGHKDWIDITSLSEGVDQSVSASAGARSAGKSTLRPVIITKAVDGTTPALREAALTGKVIKEATIEYGRLTLVLKDVRVLSAASSGEGAELTEQISLLATQAEWRIPGTPGIKPVSFNTATGKP